MALFDRLRSALSAAISPSKAAPKTAPETADSAGLTDAEGKPVDIDVLHEEHAAPSIGGVRSVLMHDTFGVLDPMRLKTILNNAIQGQADDYLTLAEEMEERYLHYGGQLQTRKLAVCGLDLTVESASDDAEDVANADLIRDFIERDTLDAETFDVLDALGKGYSVTELCWDKSKIPWMPALETRDPRWFEFDQSDMKTLLLKGGPDNTSAMPTQLEPYKHIIHRGKYKTGLTIRGGLARAAAWAYLFQNMSLKDWVIMAEVYGMPIRVGKYDKTATDSDRYKLLRAVTSIGTDAAAVIPDSMTIEFVNAIAGASPDMYRDLCEYLDKQVSKLILGQTGTADATTGGFGSSGQVHADVRTDIRDADAKALAATLNRDLVRPLIDLNMGPPKSGKYPRIKIGQAERFTEEDRKNYQFYIDNGGPVEASHVADKMGIPDAPETGKDGKPVKLLRPKAASPQNPGPQGGADGAGGPEGAAAASLASGPFLKLLKTTLKSEIALAAAAQGRSGAETDAIDDMIDQIGGDDGSGWIEVMAPLLEPIEAEVQAATSYDDFKDRLIGALSAMDASKMTDLLATASFNARLAGEAGEAIHE